MSTVLNNNGVVKTLDNGIVLNSVFYPNENIKILPDTIENRNLLDITKTSNPKACFDALRKIDLTKLRLGDYIDIPKWSVIEIHRVWNPGGQVIPGPEGGTIETKPHWDIQEKELETTTDANFRFQIAGVNHYGPDSGILFESVNIPFKRAMTDNNSNALGYEGSDLRQLINNTFKPELEKRIGPTKPITRYLDKDQCKSGNFVTDSVYVPNYTELFGNEPYQNYTGSGATESIKNSKQFQIHSVGGINSRIKNYNGSSWYYWTASTSSSHTVSFCGCSNGGHSDSRYAYNRDGGVAVCFNIENTYKDYKSVLQKEGVVKSNLSSVFYESASTSDNTEATDKTLLDSTGVLVKKANKGATLSQVYWDKWVPPIRITDIINTVAFSNNRGLSGSVETYDPDDKVSQAPSVLGGGWSIEDDDFIAIGQDSNGLYLLKTNYYRYKGLPDFDCPYYWDGYDWICTEYYNDFEGTGGFVHTFYPDSTILLNENLIPSSYTGIFYASPGYESYVKPIPGISYSY